MTKRIRRSMSLALIALPLAFAQTACSGEDGGETTAQAKQALYSGEDVFQGLFFGVGPGAKLLPEVWDNPDYLARLERCATSKTTAQIAADIHTAAESLKATSPEAAAQLETMSQAVAHGELTKSAQNGAERNALASVVTERLKAGDRSFFLRFGADMQSGNQARVDRALRSVTTKMIASVATANGVDTASLRGDGLYGWWATSTVAVQAFYVAAYAAVAAVAVAVVVGLAWSDGQDVTTDACAGLDKRSKGKPGSATTQNKDALGGGMWAPTASKDLRYDMFLDDLTQRLAPR